MKAVVYEKYGAPEVVITLAELPSPKPHVGEVIVALEAAPIHLADLKNITGEPWFRAPLPATPGYEGVGRIIAVGDGVLDFREGDRVFLPPAYGAWQEERAVTAHGLWRAPEGHAPEQLALLPINLQTAYLMLREDEPLLKGEWLIQNAANSNVGFYVIRLARTLGFRTINVVRRADVVEDVVRACGDVVLVDGDDLADRVGALGHTVRLAIDAVGGDGTARLASCLSERGSVLNYGFLSGDIVNISAQQMMFRQLRMSGFFTKASIARMGERAAQTMRDNLSAFIAADRPDAPIAAVHHFAQIREALSHAARTGSARAGKIIIKP